MDTAQRAWARPAPPGPPAVVYRRPPGTGGGRLLGAGARAARVSPGRRSSGRLSAAASLPLLLQDAQSDDEDAPSLSNILDAVPGLEVADDEGGDAPCPRRPPTPPPRTTPLLRPAGPAASASPLSARSVCSVRSDLYYCKPWPPLEGRPVLRRPGAGAATAAGARDVRQAAEPLPPPPRLPDHFDERQYRENRQLRRRSYHQQDDGSPASPGSALQQWAALQAAPRPRVLPTRSQSLRTARPPPIIIRQVRR